MGNGFFSNKKSSSGSSLIFWCPFFPALLQETPSSIALFLTALLVLFSIRAEHLDPTRGIIFFDDSILYGIPGFPHDTNAIN